MKSLKLRAEHNASTNTARITILKQSHFGEALGPAGGHFSLPDCKYTLFGTGMDSRFQDDRFVCLNSRYNASFQVPVRVWPEIKRLVTEYNKWGAAQK